MSARVFRGLAAPAILSLAGCGGVPIAGEGAQSGSSLDQPALLAASCSGCHAAGGSRAGIASLKGMTSGELRASLLFYRKQPGGSAMHRMARGYTEQQIAAIANYLGE